MRNSIRAKMNCFILLSLFGFMTLTNGHGDPCIDQNATARNLVVCFKSEIGDSKKILKDCFHRYCSGIRTRKAVICIWTKFPKCALKPSARCVNYSNAQNLVNCMCNL